MFAKTLPVLSLVAALVLGGAVAASADTAAQVTADPASIEIGAETTVTATGLGGLETAYFGLNGPSGGTLTDPATGEASTTLQVTVDNGVATARFSASATGDFTVAVGNGETPLAETTVTVTAPSPAPAPTVTVTVTPDPAPEPSMTATGGGESDASMATWGIVLIVVLAVLVVGAIVTIIVLAARCRDSGSADRLP